MDIQDKIVELYEEGYTSGKIAQKLKVKKVVVEETLGTNAKSKGIGDSIQEVTGALGLDVVAETVASAAGADDCGCKARAKALNKLFPYKRMNDLLDSDYFWLEGFFAQNKSSVDTVTQKTLVDIYNRVFSAKRKVSNCSPCVASMIRDLRKVYDAAKN
jgi:hypothetical protein